MSSGINSSNLEREKCYRGGKDKQTAQYLGMYLGYTSPDSDLFIRDNHITTSINKGTIKYFETPCIHTIKGGFRKTKKHSKRTKKQHRRRSTRKH